jgi:hypothetical protein
MLADGFHPDGTARPRRRVRVEDTYGPSNWPVVTYDDTGETITIPPSCLDEPAGGAA